MGRDLAGAFWFVSARLADPQSHLLVDQIGVLRSAVALARARWQFGIDTAIVLPAEILMIWNLPAGDDDIASRWRLIRSAFARQAGGADVAGLWQSGFLRRQIRDASDLDLHRHLCATAPIRAGLVRRAGDWPHSSARQTGPQRGADPVALSTPLPKVRGPLSPVAVH